MSRTEHRKKKAIMRVHPAAIALLRDTTWAYAHYHLWRGFAFGPLEVVLAKTHIEEQYREIPPEHFQKLAGLYLADYCDMILLSAHYVRTHPDFSLPLPHVWLDGNHPKGFYAILDNQMVWPRSTSQTVCFGHDCMDLIDKLINTCKP